MYRNVFSGLAKIGMKLKNFAATKSNRFGVEHPSKLESVKKRKVEKSLKKYGTSNVFQAEEVKKKCRATMMKNYGVESSAHLEHIDRNNGKRSKLQIIVEDFLSVCGIAFEYEKRNMFSKFNDKMGRIYSPVPDIYIDDLKVVVEVYGEGIHADPRVYAAEDELDTWGGDMTAAEIWAKDKNRKEHIESFGISLIEIWQRDVRNNKFKKILAEFLNGLGANIPINPLWQ